MYQINLSNEQEQSEVLCALRLAKDAVILSSENPPIDADFLLCLRNLVRLEDKIYNATII